MYFTHNSTTPSLANVIIELGGVSRKIHHCCFYLILHDTRWFHLDLHRRRRHSHPMIHCASLRNIPTHHEKYMSKAHKTAYTHNKLLLCLKTLVVRWTQFGHGHLWVCSTKDDVWRVYFTWTSWRSEVFAILDARFVLCCGERYIFGCAEDGAPTHPQPYTNGSHSYACTRSSVTGCSRFLRKP